MKTPRFTIFDLKRSSGRESALTSPRLNHAASTPLKFAQPSADNSPSPGGEGRGEGGLRTNFNRPVTRNGRGANRPLQRFNVSTFQRNSERAIALVITLILLSVTLVMAVAILAISRRERGSVTTTEDTAAAKFAVDAAFAKAQARIVSQILSTTNPYISSLLVSTNYINRNGFTNSVTPVANLENVNYDYYAPGQSSSGPLNAQDLEQNIANLYYDPRPPVYYSNDFRFYLDLNRNGMYDTNGWVTNIDNFGNGLGTVSWAIGDPEWVGILAHPDQPHGPNNPFIARYCFIAVPADSLDLNYIHNQSLDDLASYGGPNTYVNPNGKIDAYWRDQGVGTWEINLAAFLTDLNTNYWDNNVASAYSFPEAGPADSSTAFNDARALIARREYYYSFLPSAQTMFGNSPGWFGLPPNSPSLPFNNGVDYYGIGRQSTYDANFSSYANLNLSWAGAPQTNDFFSSPSELFNVNEAGSFANNLYSVGTNISTYNRYTFYRMLGQLGTDTAPGAAGKINLNYSNALVNLDGNGILTNFAIVPNLETNFQQWHPQEFFTAAANQMLRMYTTEWFEESPSNYMQTYYNIYPSAFVPSAYTNLDGLNVTNIQYLGQTNQIPAFGLTNIPVYMNGAFVYTPAVNRLLQLAANIFDASTNTSTTINSNYPSVFRPIIWKTNEFNAFLREFFTNVYVKGYQYIPYATNGVFDAMFSAPLEVNDPNLPFGYSTSNVWGVPWILGAKKGFPNLNQLEVVNSYFIERTLQMQKKTIDPATMVATNQMYIMGITNYYGDMDLNSYAESYNNPVAIVANNDVSLGLTWTNEVDIPAANMPGKGSSFVNTIFSHTNMPIVAWSGLASQMMFGTNIYNYSFSIPGASILQQNTFQNAEMNSSDPAFLAFDTNSAYVYYYGPNPVSFRAPFGGIFNFDPPCFIPTFLDPSNYLDSGTPPLPQMTLWVTNHLQAYMIDNTGHILDYVQLGNMNNSMNVNRAVADNSIIQAAGEQGYTTGLWSTNFFQGDIPYGINAQYLVSQGSEPVPTEDLDGGQWSKSTVTAASGKTYTDPAAQQAFFLAFLSPTHTANYFPAGNPANGSEVISNYDTSMQLPYTPTRRIVQRFVYEANDPLVHYMASDLYDFQDTSNSFTLDNPPLLKLVSQDKRYMPWGTQGNMANSTLNGVPADSNPDNISYKDPLVTGPDYWDFPTNKYPTVGWLGRVHRGTPWQTVYLKSPDILIDDIQGVGNRTLNEGVPTWQLWTGDIFNTYDAVNTAPDQDRLLFDLFTAAPDDDATRGQLSVNIGADDANHDPLDGLASWSALLSGIAVFTNDVSDITITFRPPNPPRYSLWTNQPLGAPLTVGYPGGNITNVALYQIVAGINSARTNYGAYPTIDGLQNVYEHVGDILRVPQLSVASPYLNDDAVQQPIGINDEMYEWLPQQMLGLLTASGTPQNPPRYVVYCYGQTLKPAPNGIVTSGSFIGMCTNYQVQAESGARVVIEVQNPPTPVNPTATPHIVVEQYNTLPPD